MVQPKNLSRIARILFVLIAVFWVILGILNLARMSAWSESQFFVTLAVAVAALGNAAILFWFGVMVGKEPPRYLLPAVLYVALSLVLSITDDFGIFDFLFLIYYLVLFAICLRLFLLANRRT